ncbi:hypothetical protein ACA910_014494 [Epithemia clementina (nom. ined.)]
MNVSTASLLIDNPDELFSKARGDLLQGLGVEDEAARRNCNLYGDTPDQMTSGRLLARCLSRFSFYYRKREGGPDLDEAWAHYEHMTLARIYSDEKPGRFVRAPFGEQKRPTQLYPLWSTPTRSFSDFGVSVRMYFSTLLALSTFLGIAGILNLPLITYFWHKTYSSGIEDLALPVRASAVCADTEWVECDTCEGNMAPERLNYQNPNDDDGAGAYFYPYALMNSCNFSDWLMPGILSFGASLLLVAQFAFAFFWLQPNAEVVFDEEMQTASDYSIKISNPPDDAIDPAEWRDYLVQFGPVAVVTVAIDNAQLLQKLLSHRRTRMQLARKLPASCDTWDREQVEHAIEALPKRWCCSIPFICPSAAALWARLQEIQQEVEEMARRPYKAVSVFVTFETERAQRNCLYTLTPSKLNLWRQKIDTSRFDQRGRLVVEEQVESSRLPETCVDLVDCKGGGATEEFVVDLPHADTEARLKDALGFRGKHVVAIKEATEPTDVRWMDLEVSSFVRFAQYLATTFVVLWFMHWSAYFIGAIYSEDPGSYLIPLFITVTNILVPKICEFINKFESHSTEGARQASLYIKVALFRWFNSGIALLLVTRFTDTISFNPFNGGDSLNQGVYNIIFAELVTIPIIKLVDIIGFVRKHILAPRAEDQDEMNSYFIGGKFELSERYTDATKVLFVSLFYSSILPSSLFLGSFALITHFVVAKFCMLRMWRPSPDVGASLSRLSRNYFFTMALLIHIIMSAYWWSGYPFDNLCEGDNGYYFCNQDFLRSGIFPPLPKMQPDGDKWMTKSQETITSLYAWTAFVILFIGIALLIKENIFPYIVSIFKSTYEPDGADQNIPFSAVKHLNELVAFVPQLRLPGFSHPLLACDISKIDRDVIGWKDDRRGYDDHSLVVEANRILGHETDHVIFPQIQQWTTKENATKQ